MSFKISLNLCFCEAQKHRATEEKKTRKLLAFCRNAAVACGRGHGLYEVYIISWLTGVFNIQVLCSIDRSA
jgi:hypothetical protein